MQTGRAEGGPGPEARRTQPVRFSDGRLTPIWDKVQAGARLTAAEGLILLETEDLLGVGRMADHVKRRREADRVYFVINRHVTPTNLCVLSCTFCGFARKKGEAGAYEHSIEDMVAMVKDAVRSAHIVRGHHPARPSADHARRTAATHHA